MSKQQKLDGGWADVVRAPRANVSATKAQLNRWYINQKKPISEIANKLDTSHSTARRLLKDADISLRDSSEARELVTKKKREEREYIDEELLRNLHHEKEMSTAEIADEFDVTRQTISYWLKKFDIELIDYTSYQIPKFSLSCDNSNGYIGYPVWRGCDGRIVLVHRLVLVAEGLDPHDVYANKNMNTHHRNGHKADNRPSNLELVDRKEHGKRHTSAGHYSNKWTDDDIEATIKILLNPGILVTDDE